MIVGLVFGLATGVGLGFAIKYFVDGRRPKPHKDNKVNHQEKEYFCPDCRTFRSYIVGQLETDLDSVLEANGLLKKVKEVPGDEDK